LPAWFKRGAAPIVLCISRHDPRKGVDRLLAALAGLRAENVPFRACLLGRGPLIDAHRAMSTALGIDDAVWIPGQVPEVGPYLDCADVFVLPSLEEGSGSLALLEAMQAGLPIVASDCDGIPEDLRPSGATDGEASAPCGLLVSPGDSDALQVALARVLGDSTLRATLGRAARSLYEERFAAGGFVEALRSTYAELGVESQ
jgi:glycosyltransferase involved in cell wall biosynthesis